MENFKTKLANLLYSYLFINEDREYEISDLDLDGIKGLNKFDYIEQLEDNYDIKLKNLKNDINSSLLIQMRINKFEKVIDKPIIYSHVSPIAENNGIEIHFIYKKVDQIFEVLYPSKNLEFSLTKVDMRKLS